MIEFKLPSMGADMDEGKLLEWKVKPGDRVRRGDIVAVVDTTKAAVEVEIWEDGTMHEWIVQPGETVPVGTVLALLLAPGEDAATAARPRIAAAAPGAALLARKRISPAARKRAAELGVDPDKLVGSGPEGAVTVEDVEKARAPAAPVDRDLEMRKAIAAAMSRSKREIPHYYLSETVPMLRAVEWLARENEKRPVTGRLLMAVVQLKAVALAVSKFPDLNGFWRGVHVPSSAAHIGVAISLRQGGLVAPAIHDVQSKSLEQLMQSLTDLVKRARAGSLRSSEMSDPTITVTNLGEGGVETVFGVIYPPQVALVGFGGLKQQSVVASLAADHRVSDGHRGSLFLAEIAKLLQEPEKL
jgi:pyruvate dehydrogenase E2 component (dihydrolipoamide acetyltransferase)